MKHANSNNYEIPSGGYQVTFYASETSPIASIYAYDQAHVNQILYFYMATIQEIQPNIDFHYKIEELPEW